MVHFFAGVIFIGAMVVAADSYGMDVLIASFLSGNHVEVSQVDEDTHTPTVTPTPTPPPGDALTAYWNLNEGSGSSAADVTGNGYNGTVTGAVWATGYTGSALDFDGNGDYVDLANDIFDSHSSGTIAAWIKPEALGNLTILASGSDSDVNYFFKFFVFNTSGSNLHLYVGAKSPTNNYVRSTTSLTVGEWYHVAATSDGSQWRLYINGVEETLVVFSGSNAGRWFSSVDVGVNSYMLGSLQSALTVKETFNGVLDEVRVYNRPLSVAEISSWWNTLPLQPRHWSLPLLILPVIHPLHRRLLMRPGIWHIGNSMKALDRLLPTAVGNGRHGTVAGAHWVPKL